LILAGFIDWQVTEIPVFREQQQRVGMVGSRITSEDTLGTLNLFFNFGGIPSINITSAIRS
jgi:hypothetical protein